MEEKKQQKKKTPKTKKISKKPSSGKKPARLSPSQKTLLRKRQLARRTLLFLAALLLLAVLIRGVFFSRRNRQEDYTLSDSVLQHEALVDQYTEQYGITQYKNYILAIIQVESAGLGADIMQSSESLGLSPNSLGTEESVRQGCAYFSTLLNYGESLGCDIESVVQAYNYGIGFLDFVNQNGKAYSFELAQQYASQMSGGSTVAYTNPIALQTNGGWRYTYGNMFYVMLVEQYLPEQ